MPLPVFEKTRSHLNPPRSLRNILRSGDHHHLPGPLEVWGSRRNTGPHPLPPKKYRSHQALGGHGVMVNLSQTGVWIAGMAKNDRQAYQSGKTGWYLHVLD